MEAGAELSDLGSGQLKSRMTILGDNSLSSGGTSFRGPYLLGRGIESSEKYSHIRFT